MYPRRNVSSPMLVVYLFRGLTKFLRLCSRLEEKAEQERKRFQNVYIFVGLTAGSQNVRERICAVSGSHNGENERVCAISLSKKCKRMSSWKMRVYIGTPIAWDKIKVADVVVSTNHEIFLTYRFPRLISLPTSNIFVSGTSGIMAILEYRNVNHIR